MESKDPFVSAGHEMLKRFREKKREREKTESDRLAQAESQGGTAEQASGQPSTSSSLPAAPQATKKERDGYPPISPPKVKPNTQKQPNSSKAGTPDIVKKSEGANATAGEKSPSVMELASKFGRARKLAQKVINPPSAAADVAAPGKGLSKTPKPRRTKLPLPPKASSAVKSVSPPPEYSPSASPISKFFNSPLADSSKPRGFGGGTPPDPAASPTPSSSGKMITPTKPLPIHSTPDMEDFEATANEFILGNSQTPRTVNRKLEEISHALQDASISIEGFVKVKNLGDCTKEELIQQIQKFNKWFENFRNNAIDQSLSDLKDYNEMMDALDEALTDQKKENEVLTKQVGEEKELKEEWKKRYEDLLAELQSSKDKEQDLEETIKKHEVIIEEQRKQLEELQKKLDGNTEVLRGKDAYADEIIYQNEKNEKELRDLRQSLEVAQAAANLAETQKHHLEQQLTEKLEKTSLQKDRLLAELTKTQTYAKSQRDEEVQELNDHLAALKEEMRAQLSQKDGRIRELEAEVQAEAELARKAEDKCMSLQGTYSGAEQSKEKMKAQIDQLYQDLMEMEMLKDKEHARAEAAENNFLEAQVALADSQRHSTTAIQRQMTESQQQLNVANQEIQNLESLTVGLQSKIHALEDKIEELKDDHRANLDEVVNDCQAKIRASDADKAQLNIMVSDRAERCKLLEADLRNLRNEKESQIKKLLDAQKKANADSQKEIDRLHKENLQLSQGLQNTLGDFTKSEGVDSEAFDKLREELARVSSELEREVQRNRALEQQNQAPAGWDLERERLADDLARLEADLREAKADTHKMALENSRLEDELNQAEDDLRQAQQDAEAEAAKSVKAQRELRAQADSAQGRKEGVINALEGRIEGLEEAKAQLEEELRVKTQQMDSMRRTCLEESEKIHAEIIKEKDRSELELLDFKQNAELELLEALKEHQIVANEERAQLEEQIAALEADRVVLQKRLDEEMNRRDSVAQQEVAVTSEELEALMAEKQQLMEENRNLQKEVSGLAADLRLEKDSAASARRALEEKKDATVQRIVQEKANLAAEWEKERLRWEAERQQILTQHVAEVNVLQEKAQTFEDKLRKIGEVSATPQKQKTSQPSTPDVPPLNLSSTPGYSEGNRSDLTMTPRSRRTLEQEVIYLHGLILDMKRIVAQSKKERDDLQNQSDMLIHQTEELQRLLKESFEEKSDMQNRLDDQARQHLNLQEQFDDMQQTYDQLSKELSMKPSQKQAEDNARLKNEMAKLSSELRAALDEGDEKERAMMVAQDALKRREAEVEDLTEKLKDKEDCFRREVVERHNQEQRAIKDSQELANLRQVFDLMSVGKEDMEKELQLKDRELQQLKQQVDEISMDADRQSYRADLMKKEVETLQNDVARLEEDRYSAEEQAEVARRELRATRREMEELRRQKQNNEEQARGLEQDLDDAKHALGLEKKAKEDALYETDNQARQLDELQQALEQSTATITRLEQRLEAQRNQVQSQKQRLEELQPREQEAKDLADELEVQKQRLEASEARRAELEEEVVANRDRLESLEAAHQDTDQSRASLHKSLGKASDDLIALRNELANIQEEKDILSEQLNEAEAAAEEQEEAIIAMQKEIAAKDTELERQKLDYDELLAKKRDLEAEVVSMEEEVDALNGDLKKKEDEYQEANDTLAEKLQELGKAKMTLDALKSANEQLAKSGSDQSVDLKKKLADITTLAQLADAKSEELQKELDETNSALDAARAQAKATKSLLDGAQKDNKGLKQALSEAIADRKLIEKSYDDLANELEQEKSKAENASEALGSAYTKKSGLEKQLANALKENKHLLAENAAANEEVKNLSQQLSEMEGRLLDVEAGNSDVRDEWKKQKGLLQNETAEKNKKINELQLALEDAKANVQDLDGKLAEKEAALNTTKQKLVLTEKALEDERNKGWQERTALEDRLKNASDQQKMLEEEVADLSEQIPKLQSSLQAEKQRANASERQYNLLRPQYDDKDRAHELAEMEKMDLEKELDNSKAELEDARDDLGRLKAALEKASQKNADLQGEIGAYAQAREGVLEDLSEARDKNNQLENDLTMLKEQLVRAEREVGRSMDKAEELAEFLEKSEAHVGTLQEELREETQRRKHAEQKANELEDENDRMQDKILEQSDIEQRHLEDMDRVTHAAREEQEILQDQVEKLKKDLENSEKNGVSLNKLLGDKDAKIKELTEDFEDKGRQLDEAMDLMNKAATEMEAKKEEFAAMKAQIQEKESRLVDLEGARKGLEAIIKDKDKKCKDTYRDLCKAQGEVDLKETEIKDLKDQVKSLRVAAHKMNKKNSSSDVLNQNRRDHMAKRMNDLEQTKEKLAGELKNAASKIAKLEDDAHKNQLEINRLNTKAEHVQAQSQAADKANEKLQKDHQDLLAKHGEMAEKVEALSRERNDCEAKLCTALEKAAQLEHELGTKIGSGDAEKKALEKELEAANARHKDRLDQVGTAVRQLLKDVGDLVSTADSEAGLNDSFTAPEKFGDATDPDLESLLIPVKKASTGVARAKEVLKQSIDGLANLKDQLNQTAEQLQRANHTEKELEKENSELLDRLNDAENERDQVSSAASNAKSDLSSLKAKQTRLEAENKQLRLDLSRAKEEKRVAEEKCDTSQLESELLRSDLEAVRAAILKWQKDGAEKGQALGLSAGADQSGLLDISLGEGTDSIVEMVRAVVRDCEDLSTNMIAAKGIPKTASGLTGEDIARLQTDLQSAKSRVADRDTRVAALQASIKKYDEELKGLRKQLRVATSEKRAAQHAADSQKESCATLNKEITELNRAMESKSRDLKKAADENARLSNRLREKESALASAKRELANVKEENLTLQQSMETRTEISIAAPTLPGSKDQKIAGLWQELQRVTREKQALKQRLLENGDENVSQISSAVDLAIFHPPTSSALGRRQNRGGSTHSMGSDLGTMDSRLYNLQQEKDQDALDYQLKISHLEKELENLRRQLKNSSPTASPKGSKFPISDAADLFQDHHSVLLDRVQMLEEERESFAEARQEDKKKAESLEQQIKDLTGTIASVERERNELKNQLKDLGKDHGGDPRLKEKLKDQEEHIKSLMNELTQAEGENRNLQQALNSLYDEDSDLTMKMKYMREIEGDYASSKQRAEALEEENRTLSAEAEHLKSLNQELEMHNKMADAELEKVKSQLESVRLDLGICKEEKAKCMRSVNTLGSQLVEMNIKSREADGTRDQTISELETQVRMLQEQNKSLQRTVDQGVTSTPSKYGEGAKPPVLTPGRQKIFEAEISALENELDKTKRALAEANDQVKRLTTERDFARRELDDLQQVLENPADPAVAVIPKIRLLTKAIHQVKLLKKAIKEAGFEVPEELHSKLENFERALDHQDKEAQAELATKLQLTKELEAQRENCRRLEKELASAKTSAKLLEDELKNAKESLDRSFLYEDIKKEKEELARLKHQRNQSEKELEGVKQELARLGSITPRSSRQSPQSSPKASLTKETPFTKNPVETLQQEAAIKDESIHSLLKKNKKLLERARESVYQNRNDKRGGDRRSSDDSYRKPATSLIKSIAERNMARGADSK